MPILFVGVLLLLSLVFVLGYIDTPNIPFYLFDLVVLMIVIAALTIAYDNIKSKKYLEGLQHDQVWQTAMYKQMPASICVEQYGKIVFKNQSFQMLQESLQQANPFAECNWGQNEISLEVKQGLPIDFLVHKFLLNEGNEVDDKTAYLAVSIQTLRDQQSFLHQLSENRHYQQKPVINLVVDAIHQALPKGLIYLGRYDRQNQSFTYLAHQSQDSELQIFDELLLPDELIQNAEGWFNLDDNAKALLPSSHGLTGYSAEDRWAYVIRNNDQQILGIVFILLPYKQTFSQGFIDFLSILVYQIQLELAHSKDQLKLEQNTKRYRSFIQNSNDAILDLKIDPAMDINLDSDKQWDLILENGQVAQINQRFCSLFEVPKNADTTLILNTKSIKHVIRYILQSSNPNSNIETRFINSSGEVLWLQCTTMAEIYDDKLFGIWLMTRDITENRTHIERLEYKTRHDDLTGLPNRNALSELLDEKIELAKQFGLKVGLLFFDLDRFKEVNDALGHNYGDVLLKKIPQRINNYLQPINAKLCRLGGDEFAIVIPTIENTAQVLELAKDIQTALRQAFDLGQLHVEVSASLGVSCYPENGSDVGTLMRCADVAMYKAKHTPGGILSYSANLDEGSPRRLAIMAAINSGLKQDQFFLHYQPKMDLKTGHVTAAEALIRWQHPEMGLISPGEFIPLAEMSDIIIDLTEWVLDQAIYQLKKFQLSQKDVRLSVNVSTRNLLDDNLVPYIHAKLEEYDVRPQQLELEITESALMVDPDRALETLNKLSGLGLSISVDDFGTGYSSLVYLRRLPIDSLKIDLMFVRNMCRNDQDAIIVNSIINLGHNLSLTVVAEGAEDKATVEVLKTMGCDYVQGYQISKPVPEDEFLRLLDE
ncbi:GGDEF and EAL domain-containing protein [Bermanella marisrubri]|nr:GGDEF and EAL domain-containing protein [Bermanella marisrubri]